MDVTPYKTHYSNCGNKLSDFKILKELGKGSYGTVYTVRSYIDDNIYVMKKMELNTLKEKQQKECYREVSILKKVSHQNIIKYYSSFLDSGNLYIIMEYAEGGDLYSLIKHYKRHNKHFDEFDIWRIAYEVLNGLDYLHKSNIIHRDIKCLNLFITKDQHIKIGDLGVSTIVSNINALHCTRVGTPLYLSPELVKQVPYDFKVDIWSCGCSVYHLANLDPPFIGDNLIVLGNNIVKGKPKALPQQYSEELNAFIDKMLSKRPEKRPSAKEGLEMIPKEIMEKIKVAKEKNLDIKVRPFSAVGNRIITYNKEEIIKEDKAVNKDGGMPKIEECKEKSNNEGGGCNGNNNNNNGGNKKDKQLGELVKQNVNSNNNNNNIIVDNNNFVNHGNGISSNKKELIALLNNNNNNNNVNINNNNNNNTPKPQIKNNYNNYLINAPTPISSSNTNKNFQSLNAFRSKHPTPPQNPNLIAINQSSHHHSKNQPSKLIDTSIKDKTKSRIIGGFGGLVLPQPLINIEKVENFMINDDNTQKLKPSSNNFNHPQPQQQRPPSSTTHKNLIPHQRNSSLSPKEHITEAFKFPDLTTSKQPLDSIPDIKSTFSRRLLSSKFPRHNTPSLKTRPLTASSTKILSSKWKSSSSSTRPVTAFIPRHFRNNNNETPTTSENEGGVINININLYNIDMNRRFLDPSLNPLKQGNDLSMLMNSNRNNNDDVYNNNNNNNKCFGNITHNNLYKQTVNLQDIAQHNSNNEFIFAKIIKTIEHARKGNKPLTIRDFEESSSK